MRLNEPIRQIDHPWDKATRIAARIRRAIVSGRLGPGQKVPTRQELGRKHGTTMATVQKALGRLEAAGFIESRGWRGTFVSASPPHRCQFGIVFQGRPELEPFGGWSRFWKAIHRSAGAAITADRRFRFYFGVTGHADEESLQRLLSDVVEDRLAGVFFPAPPDWLEQYPALLHGQAKLAAITNSPYLTVAPVRLASEAFVDKALGRVADRGLKRVAVMGVGPAWPKTHDQECESIQRRAAALGLACPAHWVVPIDPRRPETARVVTQLLMQGRPADRPEALVVTDDHLVEQATRGLASFSPSVRGAVEVVAHTNFPLRPTCHTPATLLGLDAARVVSEAVKAMRGESRGDVIEMEFEDEVRAREAGGVFDHKGAQAR